MKVKQRGRADKAAVSGRGAGHVPQKGAIFLLHSCQQDGRGLPQKQEHLTCCAVRGG